MSYYIPHQGIIMTNEEHLPQFDAEKILLPFYEVSQGVRDNSSPWMVEIHLTGNCQYRCPYCSYNTRQQRTSLEIAKIEEIFIELAKKEVRSILFSGGGDPLAFNEWQKLMELKKKHLPNTYIGVSTNLYALDRLAEKINVDDINFYQVHIVGYDETSCIEGSGINSYEKICQNLEILRQSKSYKVFKIVIGKNNYTEVNEYLDYIKNYLPDSVVFKLEQNFLTNEETTALIDLKYLLESIKTNEINQYYKEIIDTSADNILDIPCEVKTCNIVDAGLYCMIRETGEVFPCIASSCNSSNSIGNINNENLSIILENEAKRREISRNMQNGTCPIQACRHYRFNKIIEAKKHNLISGFIGKVDFI